MFFYIIILLLAFGLTFLVKEIAIRKSVLDIPNERSSHTIPTPRGGGLAIVIAWYLGLGYFFYTGAIENDLFFALLFGLLIVAVSLLDDVIGINYIVRLTSQAIAAAGALYFLGGLNKLDLGFTVLSYKVVLTIIAFIGIIWFINLYNFIDGIDGYAATEAIFISAAVFGLFSDNIILIIAFASLGFLVWNWQKAKIFMGDVGSTMLGFTFPVFAIWYQNNDKSSLLIWAILSSLFWFDATLTLFRRFMRKERLSQAHRKHAYQRIVQAGFSHQKTVLFSIGLNLFILAMAYFSVIFNQYIFLFLMITLITLFGVVKRIDSKKKFE